MKRKKLYSGLLRGNRSLLSRLKEREGFLNLTYQSKIKRIELVP
jgi:hypothetical protein